MGFFGPLAVGDVSEDDGIVFLMFYGDKGDCRFDRKLFSIRPKPHHRPQFPHLSARRAGLAELTYMVAVTFAILSGQESIKMPAYRLMSGAAEHLLGRMVEQHHMLSFVNRDDCIHRRFNDAFEPQLADQELFFRLLATDDGTDRLPIRVVTCLLRLHHQPLGMGSLHTFRHQLSFCLH